MITEESRDFEVEFSDHNLEVKITVRVVEHSDVSTQRILDTAHDVLAGVLTTMGAPRVERTLEIWHETRAQEARESEDF